MNSAKRARTDAEAGVDLAGLELLPDEIIELILLRLPLSDVGAVGACSSHLRRVASSDAVWRPVAERYMELPKAVIKKLGEQSWEALCPRSPNVIKKPAEQSWKALCLSLRAVPRHIGLRQVERSIIASPPTGGRIGAFFYSFTEDGPRSWAIIRKHRKAVAGHDEELASVVGPFRDALVLRDFICAQFVSGEEDILVVYDADLNEVSRCQQLPLGFDLFRLHKVRRPRLGATTCGDRLAVLFSEAGQVSLASTKGSSTQPVKVALYDRQLQRLPTTFTINAPVANRRDIWKPQECRPRYRWGRRTARLLLTTFPSTASCSSSAPSSPTPCPTWLCTALLRRAGCCGRQRSTSAGRSRGPGRSATCTPTPWPATSTASSMAGRSVW
eukprot:TRINITY_DN1365_c1_g2_i1.p1 TRINITY_DN1365_c1_g2~~TRINITY_DN1365_c1_g2_i1.p1  ORF type:complete len:399 (+),score=79.97 TRINITY_DN1365_c1_g2_i1:40-1197(+)